MVLSGLLIPGNHRIIKKLSIRSVILTWYETPESLSGFRSFLLRLFVPPAEPVHARHVRVPCHVRNVLPEKLAVSIIYSPNGFTSRILFTIRSLPYPLTGLYSSTFYFVVQNLFHVLIEIFSVSSFFGPQQFFKGI